MSCVCSSIIFHNFLPLEHIELEHGSHYVATFFFTAKWKFVLLGYYFSFRASLIWTSNEGVCRWTPTIFSKIPHLFPFIFLTIPTILGPPLDPFSYVHIRGTLRNKDNNLLTYFTCKIHL